MAGNITIGTFDLDTVFYSLLNDSGLNATIGNISVKKLVSCNDWQEEQHLIFQVANIAFVVAFLLPISFRYHSLLIRSMLCLGCFFMSLWGGIVICHLDVTCWYVMLLSVNICYVARTIYEALPIKLQPEVDSLYTKMFKPLQMTRKNFHQLSILGELKDLIGGDTYSIENKTNAGEQISILLSGRLKATHQDVLLHFIEPNQFIDSPENDKFQESSQDCAHTNKTQTTVTAVEDSQYISWSVQLLTQLFDTSPYHSTIINNLIGKDITIKLYQMQEIIMSKDYKSRRRDNLLGSAIYEPPNGDQRTFNNNTGSHQMNFKMNDHTRFSFSQNYVSKGRCSWTRSGSSIEKSASLETSV